MEKLIFTTAIILGLSIAANAQTPAQKTKCTKTETTKSTSANSQANCGEKGHVCTAECKKAETKSAGIATMKDHTCTWACIANTHMYVCGEKGHTCTAECKKMK